MKDLNTLLQDAKDVLDDLNIPYGDIVSCTVNTRAVSRWGQCKHIGNNKYAIEISARLMADDIEWEAAMNTMIHELIHAYNGRMCHTGEWKRCANLVNREYPIYNIKRCSTAEERGVADSPAQDGIKYIITCDACGAPAKYRKKSKVVKLIMQSPKHSRCTCYKCGGGEFTVTEL